MVRMPPHANPYRAVCAGPCSRKMSKVVGANVLRTARLEDAYAKAETSVRETMVVNATAQWHEEQTAKSMSKSLVRKRDQEA